MLRILSRIQSKYKGNAKDLSILEENTKQNVKAMLRILKEYKAKYKGNAMGFVGNCKAKYKGNGKDF